MAMTDDRRVSLLFVCMGNLCRSPLAENVFRHRAHARGVMRHFTVDSAGTGHWHVGEQPEARIRAVAAQHGVNMAGRARQVKRRDFKRFDYVICMDDDNREDLLALGAPPEKVHLLLDFDPASTLREVPDPYYGEADGFELVFKLVDSACGKLLEHLLDRHVAGSAPERSADQP